MLAQGKIHWRLAQSGCWTAQHSPRMESFVNVLKQPSPQKSRNSIEEADGGEATFARVVTASREMDVMRVENILSDNAAASRFKSMEPQMWTSSSTMDICDTSSSLLVLSGSGGSLPRSQSAPELVQGQHAEAFSGFRPNVEAGAADKVLAPPVRSVQFAFLRCRQKSCSCADFFLHRLTGKSSSCDVPP